MEASMLKRTTAAEERRKGPSMGLKEINYDNGTTKVP
jgi:hypothetical protein